MKYILITLLISLASCGSKSNKNKKPSAPPTQISFDIEEEVQTELNLEQQIEYLKQKKDKWIESNASQPYSFSAYMELPYKDGYIEAVFAVNEDKVRPTKIVYNYLRDVDSVRFPSLTGLFDKTIASLEKLKIQKFKQHCDADFEMNEDRQHIKTYTFSCDDFLPDAPNEHYEIFSMWK